MKKKILPGQCPECGKPMSEAFGSHKLFCPECHPEEYVPSIKPTLADIEWGLRELKRYSLTPEQMAYDLFLIHEHMPEADLFDLKKKTRKRLEEELPKPGIVYREEKLVKLFEKWGLPKPDWNSPEYLKMFDL